jgi:hypothetical protein
MHKINFWTSEEGNWIIPKESHANATWPLSPKNTPSNDKGLNTHIYSACGPREKRSGLDYRWNPDNVSTLSEPFQYNIASMCRIMRGRTLLFIGDSLSMHHFEATVSSLGYRTAFGLGICEPEKLYWCILEQPYPICREFGYQEFNVTLIKNPSIEDFPTVTHLIEGIYNQSKGMVVVANWGAFYVEDAVLKPHMAEIGNNRK